MEAEIGLQIDVHTQMNNFALKSLHHGEAKNGIREPESPMYDCISADTARASNLDVQAGESSLRKGMPKL